VNRPDSKHHGRSLPARQRLIDLTYAQRGHRAGRIQARTIDRLTVS
jgi:hypothetical protein